jgi:serine protease Do
MDRLRSANFVLYNLIGLCLASVLAITPANADFRQASREFIGLDEPSRTRIALGLVATGDYDGMAKYQFSEKLYRAIIAFQKRQRWEADGTLSAEERAVLDRTYEEFSNEFGFSSAVNPKTGSQTLVPLRELNAGASASARGIVYDSTDGKLEASLEVFPKSEVSFRRLYKNMIGPVKNKAVHKHFIAEQYFMVSGTFEGNLFDMFMFDTPEAVTGYVVTYHPSRREIGRKTALVMANAFIPSGDGKAAPPKPTKPPEKAAEPEKPVTSTGTGFRITEAGHVLTNFHVVGKCKTIRLHRTGELPVTAALVAGDSINDLAIVKANSALVGTVAAFAPRGAVRAGSEIAVFGFPLTGLLSDTGNFTTGNIAAMSGINNDSRVFQISAPIQPGNSGGPVIDRHGGVVAIIVSKLNAMGVAEKTGDVPQNVNFAIKTLVALGFVEGVGLETREADKTAPTLDTPSLATHARDFTFLVECNNEI